MPGHWISEMCAVHAGVWGPGTSAPSHDPGFGGLRVDPRLTPPGSFFALADARQRRPEVAVDQSGPSISGRTPSSPPDFLFSPRLLLPRAAFVSSAAGSMPSSGASTKRSCPAPWRLFAVGDTGLSTAAGGLIRSWSWLSLGSLALGESRPSTRRTTRPRRMGPGARCDVGREPVGPGLASIPVRDATPAG